MEEYERTVSELRDFLMTINDFKKKRASNFFFSMLQTLFLLFCACLFYILHVKIDFLKEIVFLPLYCNAIKDVVYYVKLMNSMRRFQMEFDYFMKESYLEILPHVFEHLFILI